MRTTKIETCPQNSTITIEDGVQRVDFFNLQMLVTPNVVFTGSVEFFIGQTMVKSILYVNENKVAAHFVSGSDTHGSMFPANVDNSFNRDTGGGGSEFKASIKITETGNLTSVQCKVHFLRRLISTRI